MRKGSLRDTACCLAALVLCSSSASPLVAYPILTFTVTSHKEPAAGQKASGQPVLPSEKTFPLLVTLGHQYLIVEAEGTRTIYDFERSRVLRINLSSAKYTDDSLYSDIGFRALEFQNRIMLGSALQAGKIAVNPMEPALVEQLFSLSNPKGATQIDQRLGEGEREFFWGEHKLMSVSDKTQELPTGYQAEYWRFLRYYAGGHPLVYRALASVKGVPQKISFVLTNMGTETRDIALNSIAGAADAPYSRAGLELAPRELEPYNTLRLLGPDAGAKLSERMDAAAKARDASMAQGQVLDAVLTNMSILIMSGDGASIAPWLAQNRDAIQSNESAHSLSGILEPRDPASAQKSLQILSELHSRSGSAGYMLDVFQGNILLGLRDGKAGAEHLLAALSVNPYLLGAWKDLGGHYYQSFQTDKAWTCWDAARRVNPQHPMLLRINEIERQLRTTFPEFF
jgi:tetratricopeptide (TPR) repeat protein